MQIERQYGAFFQLRYSVDSVVTRTKPLELLSHDLPILKRLRATKKLGRKSDLTMGEFPVGGFVVRRSGRYVGVNSVGMTGREPMRYPKTVRRTDKMDFCAAQNLQGEAMYRNTVVKIETCKIEKL